MGLSAKSLFGETPVRVSVDLLENLLAAYPRRDFQVRLWDGSIWVVECPRLLYQSQASEGGVQKQKMSGLVSRSICAGS